jgi:YHS domain-containing protein
MAEKVIDPVCGMPVQTGAAAATAEYQERTYHFCCPKCAERFEKEPEKYAGTPELD